MADALGMTLLSTPFGYPTNTVTFISHVVDASNEGVAFVFEAQDDTPITGFQFRYGARTGTPPTYVGTIESVSTSTGFPNATDVGGGSPTAMTFTPPASTAWDGLCQNITFTNSFTPTKGNVYCVTIRHSSGTIDGSNNSSFTYSIANLASNARQDFPYAVTNAAGTWTMRFGCSSFMVITGTIKYGDPIESYWSTASASTVGHRHALRFQLPTGMTAVIRGFWSFGALSGASGKNPVIGLWSTDGVLQSRSLDVDISAAAATNVTRHQYLLGGSPVTITGGTTYYIGYEVADATNGQVKLDGIKLNAAGDRAAFPGGASDWCLSTFDGSSWTDNSVVCPFAGLILSDITGSSGSGGTMKLAGCGGGLVG